MPSSPYAISLSEASREELESLSRRGTAPYQMVMRVRIVLLAAGGTANCAIAGRLGICEDTARKWRRRYWEQGLDGLADAPRPGRPSSILIDTEEVTGSIPVSPTSLRRSEAGSRGRDRLS